MPEGILLRWMPVLVTFVIFLGVWLYVWNLDTRIQRLQKEMREDRDEED